MIGLPPNFKLMSRSNDRRQCGHCYRKYNQRWWMFIVTTDCRRYILIYFCTKRCLMAVEKSAGMRNI